MARMGKLLFQKRINKEITREQRMRRRLTFCPLRILKPVATLSFKATGLWNRAYSEFINPIVRKNEFAINGLDATSAGFTILHLSDLHLDLDTRLTGVIYERIKYLKYDIAVITGDFNNFTIHSDGLALREMKKIMPAFGQAPVFGVLGNHDSLRDVHVMEKMGIKVLLNENEILTANGSRIAIAGIDDSNIFRTHNLGKALAGTEDADVTILLSHSPGIHEEITDYNIDIVLCGHIHGGQVCLPGGRMLRTYKDQGAKHVLRGKWTENNIQGWTSAGTGACGVPLRLNCPPEIVLHRLQPGKPCQ